MNNYNLNQKTGSLSKFLLKYIESLDFMKFLNYSEVVS